jgi:uncharacterized Fe-S cluster-containing radical SAM superfamily protein
MRMVELVGATAAGARVSVPIDGADDVDVVRRWARATGNTVLVVHDRAVDLVRGRVDDPVQALAPDARPGHRLWLYTNLHCNLACDYCCVSSSPRAAPRVLATAEVRRRVDEAVAAGTRELYLTGGEPFLRPDIDEVIRLGTASLPTTVLTNAMVWTGARRRLLERLDRHRLTLQVSLDGASPALHDQHRGGGSFNRALAGVRLAIGLGFRVRLAATLGADADDAARRMRELAGTLGLDPDDQLIRRVARQGAATDGLVVSRASLVPEVCVTADGVWWHPLTALDPAMRVADPDEPLGAVLARIRDEYRAFRLAGDLLAHTFPCA